MIRVARNTPKVKRSQLLKEELKTFRMLETEFRQREAEKRRMEIDEWVLKRSVMNAIRRAVQADTTSFRHLLRWPKRQGEGS